MSHPIYIASNFCHTLVTREVAGSIPGNAVNLIRNSNLSSFGISIVKSRNLSFEFRQQLFYLIWLLVIDSWHSVFCSDFDLFFNIATHSDFGATREASKMDIVSTVVGINGILRWTVTSSGAYLPRTPSRCEKNPEMNTTLRCGNVRSLSTCTVIVCKCLAIKIQKRGRGWPIFKKKSS